MHNKTNDWILDNEEIWASEVIDDTNLLLNVIRKVAYEVKSVCPEDEISDTCLVQLEKIGADGWPVLDYKLWYMLLNRMIELNPDSSNIKLCSDLLKKYSKS